MMKQMTLISLWLLLVLFEFVHAQIETPSILLHNIEKDATDFGQSVVESWSLICEQLCRSGLGGAGCGPQCDAGSQELQNAILSETDQLLQIYSPEFCGVLCINGLGGKKCGCQYHRVARNAPPDGPSKNSICTSFCNVHHITLKGCTKCAFTRNPQMPFDRRPSRRTQPPANVRQYIMFQTTTSPATVSPTHPPISPLLGVTPDWNKICEELCSQGQGGVLCKCDLPPFF